MGCPDGDCVMYYGGHGVCVSQCAGASGRNGTSDDADAKRYYSKFTPPTVAGKVWSHDMYGSYGGTYLIGDAIHGTVGRNVSNLYPTMLQYVLYAGATNLTQHNDGFSLMGMLLSQPPYFHTSGGVPPPQGTLMFTLRSTPITTQELKYFRNGQTFDSEWFNGYGKARYPPGLTQVCQSCCDACKLSYQFYCPPINGKNQTCPEDHGPWYLAVFPSLGIDVGMDADFILKT